MKKLLLLAIVAVLALGLAPASAAEAQCVLADANLGADGTVAAQCVITADANPHGIVAWTPNDVAIFTDGDGDGRLDAEPIFEYGLGDQPVQTLPLQTGKDYTIRWYNNCGGPVCGHIGTIAVR